MKDARPLSGIAAIVLAIAFNVPFSILAATYDYPDVLRRPAGDALDLFAAGGAPLVLTWHAFALTALALAPMAVVLSLSPARVAAKPGLSIGAAILGAMAGLAQAIGLWRWVFVVPALARVYADPAATPDAKRAAEQAFAILNQYGGVAVGEHIGQWLTSLFVAFLAFLQFSERKRITATIGLLAAIFMLAGVQEGVALALGMQGDIFSNATVGGFMGLTLWLIATGIGLIRGGPKG